MIEYKDKSASVATIEVKGVGLFNYNTYGSRYTALRRQYVPVGDDQRSIS